jgi:hypothetical protein|tara:strand:+ start:335 stop:664 length:330 start_codon:yes stop_codon:yes gene_type:complete
MKMKRVLQYIFSVWVIFFSSGALSLENFVGKVTYLEPTYMPSSIRFTISGGNPTCPIGKAITWSKSDIENNKVIYSTLMAAFMANRSIRIYINDGDSSCRAQYMHLLAN